MNSLLVLHDKVCLNLVENSLSVGHFLFLVANSLHKRCDGDSMAHQLHVGTMYSLWAPSTAYISWFPHEAAVLGQSGSHQDQEMGRLMMFYGRGGLIKCWRGVAGSINQSQLRGDLGWVGARTSLTRGRGVPGVRGLQVIMQDGSQGAWHACLQSVRLLLLCALHWQATYTINCHAIIYSHHIIATK